MLSLFNTGGLVKLDLLYPSRAIQNIVYSNCKEGLRLLTNERVQELQYYVGAFNIYEHNPKDLKILDSAVARIPRFPHNSGVIYHTSQYVHKDVGWKERTWESFPDLTANEPDKQ